MFRHLLILFLFLSCYGIWAQSKATLKRMEKDAQATIKYGDYKETIRIYENLLKIKPDELKYTYGLGVAYLGSNQKKEALPHFQKVYDSNPNFNNDLELMLGRAHQFRSNFEEAKIHLEKAKQKYQQLASTETNTAKKEEYEYYIRECEKRIDECNNGVAMSSQPINASIENLGPNVNTKDPEYMPLVPQDETFLIFTSRRSNTTGGKVDFGDDMYFEDIYMSKKSNEGWSNPAQPKINLKFHDSGAALSPDGKSLFLYRDNKRTRGDLYLSDFNSSTSEWNAPRKLNKNINTKYQETSLSISKDGNTLYFASDRPGGYGGLDIYYSKKDKNGEWGEAVNLGEMVNTTYDDDAPYISFDGQYLYFCSRGHATMGGYDVFKSKNMGENSWGKPENLGHPINTPEDDLHLVMTSDNKAGYYVSVDDSGYGDKDIYKLSAPKLAMIKLDKQGLDIKQPGTLISSIKDSASANFVFTVKYDYNQNKIKPEFQPAIDKLLDFMRKNPDVRIEIGGHTCNIGPYENNKTLSIKRARSVADYLISQGVDANRIQVNGYAYDEPLVPNDSEQNRSKNRRTEYKILR